MKTRSLRCVAALFAWTLHAWPALAVSGSTNAPLYLLTYDHGGLILWGTDHFAERLRNAMDWLERYPGFKLGLDNEAYVYDYLAERDPALLDELRVDLRKHAGRFGLGSCTYGQPLSTFINEESNIRQLGYALRTEEKLLGCRPYFYLMSEHAMHSQLPQILKGFGFRGAILRTHFMMYGYNPTFDAPVGWWVGLDGSRLLAVPTYPGEGAEFGRTTVDNWFLTRYPGPDAKASPEDFRKQFAHLQPLLATRADDSGLRKEKLLQECRDHPDYRWVLLEDLPAILPPPTVEMKTLPNDFTVRMPWGYCGNEIWNGCRRAEVQVLTAERLAALELLQGGTNRQADLERAWKNLLVAQHHDVQIVGLLPDARRFLSASLDASTNALAASLRFFAARMQGEGLAQVTVFNPLSWPRREWIQADIVLGKNKARTLAVRHDGAPVPTTLLQAHRFSDGNILEARVAFLAEVPALAVASYSISAATGEPPALQERVEITPQTLRVTTPFIEARLAPNGGLQALADKRTGVALLEPGKRSAFFAARIDGVDCESAGKWSLHLAGEQGAWAVARENGFIGSIPYTFEIQFRGDTPRLDCRATFHFEGEKLGQLSDDRRDSRSPFVHERKLRFKVFPVLGPGAVGVRDLPFAVSETTNRYVEGIYWTALSGANQGLAFFNRGTMGTVRENDGGFSIPLAYSMYYIWGTRILNGDFSYEFAIEPFTGGRREADLHRRALAYNFPVVSVLGTPGDGTLGQTVQPLELGSGNILLSALYPENGRVYARLYECSGQSGQATARLRNGSGTFSLTDLLGTPGRPVSFPVPFHPWQFQTFAILNQRK